MARSSKSYYIAPTAVSIVPNCNGTSSDLAVNITRGTRIKVYYPPILDLGMVDGSFQEWILSGRNRSLKRPDRPYTIYARLWKGGVPTRAASAASDSGYLVFAEQVKDDDDNWTDPYILSPNTSSTDPLNNITGADDKKYSWPPIPARQAEDGRTDYWWLKLGTVSLPDSNGERTVNLDTGILGTVEYNAQWRLNPDDLPDRPVRTVIADRGAWEETPHVVYRGQTGTRTPDGTLPAPLAAILGWEGTDPLTFTTGEPIAEPYHFESLTRHRFIAKRLDSENAALTDAELYEKLTTTSKGWEEENELETSRVWLNGALWECLVEGTTQEPWLGRSDWRYVSGGTFSLGFYDSLTSPVPIMGIAVRPAHIDETIVPFLLFSQKDATSMVTQWHWERESNKPALDEAWANTMRTAPDDPTSPLKSESRMLHLTIDDLPVGWDADGGRVGFKCTATFLMDSEETEIINSVTII